ncbi:hypothetical protein BJX70DRAFT_358417 [Aspergillus crustosus]
MFYQQKLSGALDHIVKYIVILGSYHLLYTHAFAISVIVIDYSTLISKQEERKKIREARVSPVCPCSAPKDVHYKGERANILW